MSDDQLKSIRRQIEKLSASLDRMTGDTTQVTFKEFAERYIAQKLDNPTLRDSTKLSFAGQVRKNLIPAFGHLLLGDITKQVFVGWVIKKKKETGTRRVTRFFNSRKDMIELLNAAKKEGLIESVPEIIQPDSPRNVGRALTDKEVLSILWHANRPFRFIFYVFWKMGCRPREILKWEWDMISWKETPWIDIPARISKTDRSRSIPINSDVGRYLKRRRVSCGTSRFVFPSEDPRRPQLSYHSAWNRACKRAGVKAVAYDLRRSFITRNAADGLSTLYIARLLDTSEDLIQKTYAKDQKEIMEKIVK